MSKIDIKKEMNDLHDRFAAQLSVLKEINVEDKPSDLKELLLIIATQLISIKYSVAILDLKKSFAEVVHYE